MATKVHGKAFDLSFGGTDVCATSASIALSQDAPEATNNCDTSKAFVVGNYGYTLSASGPLEFGAGSTEATLWADFTGAAATAWLASPDGGSSTSATNPEYGGNQIATAFSIDFSNSAPISYSYSGQGTGAITRGTGA